MKGRPHNISNTSYLRSILCYLGQINYAHQTKIHKETGVPSNCIGDALSFLIHHNLVSCILTSGDMKVYCLPEKVKYIKEELRRNKVYIYITERGYNKK